MDNYYSQEFQLSIEKVRTKSLAEQGNLDATWTKIRKLWSEHYGQIPIELINQRTRLLMAVRYTECLQGILWIEWLAMRGGYYQAIRELRSILESAIQAYYVDKEYQEINIEGKLAVTREMTSSGSHYGSKLIDKAKLPDKESLKTLYRELSRYNHPTLDSLHNILCEPDSDSRIVKLTAPQYDGDLLRKCYTLTEKVVRCVIKINQNLIELLH